MSKKIFISGSIKIRVLPDAIKEKLEVICQKNEQVLVGDADGVDSLIQNFFCKRAYRNLTIYSIYSTPRYNSGNYISKYVYASDEIKSMRERQKVKDTQMSIDSDSSLVIWDGRSKGCFANIRRALQFQKPVSIYLMSENGFIEDNDINLEYIERVYRSSVGYSASEALEQLKRSSPNCFKSTRAFNQFLVNKEVLRRENGIYLPNEGYREFFEVTKYRGKITGVIFKITFFDWFDKAFPCSIPNETEKFDFVDY